jgi:hypothetical protein
MKDQTTRRSLRSAIYTRVSTAIAALGELANQIGRLAEARRPWWRRLVG